MTRRIGFRLALAALFAVLSLAAPHYAVAQGSQQTIPVHHYYVTSGWGNDDFAANIYTPNTLVMYAGDTVTWRIGGVLEPHTITFGPAAEIQQLAAHVLDVKPQPHGPPLI